MLNMQVKQPVGIFPANTLPVTVTRSCPLNCAHCKAHYLKHMVHVENIEKYIDKYSSFLISGGMSYSGEIPFKPHMEKLRSLKEKYNIKYNFHIGFPQKPPFEIEKVADVVSFDFFGDEKVLEEVYGLRRETTQILDSLIPLNVKKIPHVTIGILCGKITHEYVALEVLSKHFKSIVLNVFIPTPGTKFEHCTPPPIEQVVEIFEYASKNFENVVLGCMQPKGEYRKALQEAVSKYTDYIVKPVSKDYKYNGCCSFYLI
ncbi:MAG: radical SAM protein [Fervidobacterium sp.]|nr:radical SAM protein [Fervidobacterium sp.]